MPGLNVDNFSEFYAMLNWISRDRIFKLANSFQIILPISIDQIFGGKDGNRVALFRVVMSLYDMFHDFKQIEM